ncbi:class II aldolase/adducin family protein [Bacillaceae bacterium Marseille-Q3522]|nr:class II aldolase/adducin family protein [Bacillaceae bacterium Marseille-Q3522]
MYERERVCSANKSLIELNLVKWTSGNVSLRLPNNDYVLIKPSGVPFDELTPEKMVLTDLNGTVIEGSLKPSVDLDSHLFVYKHNQEVQSICHTHSPFATAFAILGEEIPVLTTTHANVFGAPIPCSDYAAIGGDEIGKQIIENLDKNSAVLLRSHGVFICGISEHDVIKKAVILEEIAEYSYYALQKNPNLSSLDKQTINKTNHFYKTSYGQKEAIQ